MQKGMVLDIPHLGNAGVGNSVPALDQVRSSSGKRAWIGEGLHRAVRLSVGSASNSTRITCDWCQARHSRSEQGRRTQELLAAEAKTPAEFKRITEHLGLRLSACTLQPFATPCVSATAAVACVRLSPRSSPPGTAAAGRDCGITEARGTHEPGAAPAAL